MNPAHVTAFAGGPVKNGAYARWIKNGRKTAFQIALEKQGPPPCEAGCKWYSACKRWRLACGRFATYLCINPRDHEKRRAWFRDRSRKMRKDGPFSPVLLEVDQRVPSRDVWKWLYPKVDAVGGRPPKDAQ